MGDVGEGAPVHKSGCVLKGLHEVRGKCIPKDRGHGPVRLEVAGANGLAVVGIGDDDAPEPLAEVGQARREAEDRHDLGGDDDVESALAWQGVSGAAESNHDVAQGSIVDVEHALPGDATHIDVERIALVDVVVDQCR